MRLSLIFELAMTMLPLSFFSAPGSRDISRDCIVLRELIFFYDECCMTELGASMTD